MKQLFTAAVIVLFALTSCKKETIFGNGNTQTEIRSLSGFTKIEVEGTTDVTIMYGASFRVETKAYSNLLPYMETKVTGDVLRIGYRAGTNVNNDNSEVIIAMPQLSGVHTTGKSNINILSGTVDVFRAIIVGSGNIKAFSFTANEADIDIEGNGNIELSVGEKLNAKITGSCNVYYMGNPTTVTTDITGSGKVVKH